MLLGIDIGQKSPRGREADGCGHVGFVHEADVDDQALDAFADRTKLEMLLLGGVRFVCDDNRSDDHLLMQHAVMSQVMQKAAGHARWG